MTKSEVFQMACWAWMACETLQIFVRRLIDRVKL